MRSLAKLNNLSLFLEHSIIPWTWMLGEYCQTSHRLRAEGSSWMGFKAESTTGHRFHGGPQQLFLQPKSVPVIFIHIQLPLWQRSNFIVRLCGAHLQSQHLGRKARRSRVQGYLHYTEFEASPNYMKPCIKSQLKQTNNLVSCVDLLYDVLSNDPLFSRIK